MNDTDQSDWPPSSLADYYGSGRFIRHLKTIAASLKRRYQCDEAEQITYDAAADVLIKELQDQDLYGGCLIRYPTERHFFRYVYESCCHKLIDLSRSFQRRFRRLIDEHQVVDSGPGPESLVIESEERAWMQDTARKLKSKVISKMSKLDQEILLLRIDGISFQQIGERLGVAPSTAHRRYGQVIQQLADYLDTPHET